MSPSPFPQNPHGLFITGGYNLGLSGQSLSSELFTEKGWIPSLPELPGTIYHHSMAYINSTAVMAIGGKQPGQIIILVTKKFNNVEIFSLFHFLYDI
jgi:hypothetical protein